MDENKTPNNVIQFPGGKKKDADEKPVHSTPAAEGVAQKPTGAAKRIKKNKATIAGGVLAVILFTGAVNRYAFDNRMNAINTLDASSLASDSRGPASVEPLERDSAWEKQLAESLASPQVRGLASTGIGHAASAEEKLRWGTLEEKYTIVFKSDVHRIDTIMLQDSTATPAYILDRGKFLREYGQLLDDGFASARLKSSELGSEKTIETYTLFDKEKRPKGEARFELDRHKRLLSLKVEPAQI